MTKTTFCLFPFIGALLLTGCQAEDEAVPSPADNAEPVAAPMPDAPLAGETPTPGTAEPGAGECGADRLARFANVLPTGTIKSEIAQTVGHDRIRYIAPGDMVTQDLRPDRLNVETGEDGRIQLFRCG